MAVLAAKDKSLLIKMRKGVETGNKIFNVLYAGLGKRFNGINSGLEDPATLAGLIAKIARSKTGKNAGSSVSLPRLERKFFSHFKGKDRAFASALLELGRSSYIMRDDDNVYLAGIESGFKNAVNEARSRLSDRSASVSGRRALKAALSSRPVREMCRPQRVPRKSEGGRQGFQVRPKQLRGQPASHGIAYGKAHVVTSVRDLQDVQPGEILVCDAIGPAMTYVVPIVAAIIERRGGMLIHGAIIAREYGIPCVTGVADAATLIKTGDRVTVDGYVGLVTLDPNQIGEKAGKV